MLLICISYPSIRFKKKTMKRTVSVTRILNYTICSAIPKFHLKTNDLRPLCAWIWTFFLKKIPFGISVKKHAVLSIEMLFR